MGFVGRSLCSALELAVTMYWQWFVALKPKDLQYGSVIFINDAGPQERWHELIRDIDAVTGLASPKL